MDWVSKKIKKLSVPFTPKHANWNSFVKTVGDTLPCMKNERPRTFSPLSTAWLPADERAADIRSSRPCSTKTDLKSYTDHPHLPEFHIFPCVLFLQVWLGLRLLKIMFGLHLTPDLWGKINTLSLSEVLFSWKSTSCLALRVHLIFFFSSQLLLLWISALPTPAQGTHPNVERLGGNLLSEIFFYSIILYNG